MYPHLIRLRGPWEYEVLASAGGAPTHGGSVGRVELPARWGDGPLPGFTGRVRFIRRFGQPRRIDVFERVWLTLAGASQTLSVWLNEHLLAEEISGSRSAEFEVTALIRDRNVLRVEVNGDEEGGLWGEVALEIRCAAYLRDVHFRFDTAGHEVALTAEGEAVGTSERPLDLYLVLDRATVAYTQVIPTVPGQPFQLKSGPVEPTARSNSPQPQTLRLELVDGGTPWFTIEERIVLHSS